MRLLELFYYDIGAGTSKEDLSYDELSDTSPLKYSDTRKTKLTLRQINKIRKAAEFQATQADKELIQVRKMYKTPDAQSSQPFM